MRKHLIVTGNILLLTLLVLTGCKKEIGESITSDSQEENVATGSLANKNPESSCRLKTFDWPGFGTWQFHYNDKGLADQWTIDYGYGAVVETMFYDNNNRLVRAEEDFFGAANYVYNFYYSGNRLARITRVNVDLPEDGSDFAFTYNWKGQITRQDDNILDQHVLMYYDAIGNCTRTDIYFGSVLWFSDNYTFNIPSRNPKLNIPGVETGFPFYGTANVPDKWWFSSNKSILYDDGNPIILNDYDPSQTIINTGSHNFPVTVNYYDLITESHVNITLEYENCEGTGMVQNRRAQVNARETNKFREHDLPLMLRSYSRSMKEHVLKLREKYLKEIK